MMILTLIPDANNYGLIILFALACGSFSLSAQLYLWFKSLDLMQMNVIVKGVIVLWGLFIFPVSLFFSSQYCMEIFSIIFGILLGWALIRLELNVHHFLKNSRLFRDDIFLQLISKSCNHVVIKQKKSLSLSTKKMKSRSSLNPYFDRSPRIHWLNSYGLISVILVALFEEVIFRGFLAQLALANKSFSIFMFLLIFSVLVFGFSHITLGWIQVLKKMFMGLILLLTTLIFGSITSAIIAHAILNGYAWKHNPTT